MAEQKRGGGAMVPLIIVGATLFAFGTYQSTRPKPPEVNSGYTPPLDNPRTMQAPDSPPIEKDAAQRAAESKSPTQEVKAPQETSSVAVSVSNAPWLQSITTATLGNFRDGVLGILKAEQSTGGVNCSPVLTDIAQSAFTNVEKLTCTAKDGGQITAEFNEIGEGEFKVEYPNGGRIEITKNDGDFKVETRNSR